ncbi:MAG: O-antigen ligase family protein [Gammaproteobacteria bacterium]|nr:O-antigen ligase family protein [Gammaproteobacteria bacterium]
MTYVLALLVIATPALWQAVSGSRMAWCGAGLIFYLVLTILWSDSSEARQTFRILVRAVVLCCFMLAFADTVGRGLVHDRIGRWFALVGGVVALASIATYLIDSPPGDRLRGLGTVPNPVTTAQAYTAVTLFALHWAHRTGSSRELTLALASMLAATVTVFLSGSRSAWIALPAGFIAYLLSGRGWSASRFALSLATSVTALVIMLLMLVVNESTYDIVLPRGDSYRLDIWSVVLAEFESGGIWFGHGILMEDDVRTVGLTFRHAHNMFISVLRHGGVVGCAIFGATIVGMALCLLKRLDHPDARLAIALLVAGLLFSLFGGRMLIDSVGVNWWLFWLPVATCIGLTSQLSRLEHGDTNTSPMIRSPRHR